MFKGLANYPVFILTIVSILAIGYLSLYLIERIHNSLATTSVQVKRNVELNYVLINNSVYVKLKDIYLNYLYQISLLINNTVRVYRLSKIGDLYGPLVLTNNTVETILVDPVSRLIIDYLIVKSINSEISKSTNELLPPSIAISLSKSSLNYLESINGSSIFYRFKPVSYTRDLLLNRNKVYRIHGHRLSVTDAEIPFILLNNSIVDSLNVDQRLFELINKYGYVIEQREYLLNLYDYINTYLDSRTIQYVRLITSSSQYFTHIINLNNVVYNYNVLVNTSLFSRVNQVVIRDIYGFTYSANITMKFWLVVNNSFQIFLGKVVFNTNERPSVLLHNYGYITNGSYNLQLLIEYEVHLLQSLLGPAYFTINYFIQGGFENKIFIKSYTYDKLTVDLGDYRIVYRPLVNNTIVQLNITSFMNNTGVFFIVNNYYISNKFSTSFSKLSSVYVTNWVKPSVLLKTPPYVSIVRVENSRYYVVNSTDLEITYGIYLLGENSTGVLMYNPAILLDGKYIVFKHSYETTLLVTEDRIHLVYGNNYSIYKSIRDIHGFIVINEVRYHYPLICLDNSYGLTIIVNIEYIDKSMESIVLSNNSCVFIKNNIIANLTIIYRNSIDGKYVLSINSEKILLIYSYERVYIPEYLSDIYILDQKFKLYSVDNSFYILI